MLAFSNSNNLVEVLTWSNRPKLCVTRSNKAINNTKNNMVKHSLTRIVGYALLLIALACLPTLFSFIRSDWDYLGDTPSSMNRTNTSKTGLIGPSHAGPLTPVAIIAPAAGVVVFRAGDNVIVGCDTQLHKRNPAPVLDDVAYMIHEGVSSKSRPCVHLAPALPMSGLPDWMDSFVEAPRPLAAQQTMFTILSTCSPSFFGKRAVVKNVQDIVMIVGRGVSGESVGTYGQEAQARLSGALE